MPMNGDEADFIAIKALQHITASTDLLLKFLDVTGLQPENLKSEAKNPSFWAAALDFLRQNDAECTSFATNLGLQPSDLELASQYLAIKPSDDDVLQ